MHANSLHPHNLASEARRAVTAAAVQTRAISRPPARRGSDSAPARRYLAVRHPLRSRALRTPRNARAAVGLVWLLAALFSAPYLSYYGTVRYGALELCVPAWEDARRRALDVATFAAGYLLPVAVVSLAYGRTLRFLWAAVGPAGGARRALRRVLPGSPGPDGCSGNARPRGRLPAGGDWGGERSPEPAGGGEACRALPVKGPE